MDEKKSSAQYGNLIGSAKGNWENRKMIKILLIKSFLLNKEEFEKAFKCGQEYLKRNPENVKTLVFMGHAFRIRDDFKKAIECLKKATEINPENAENWIDLAFAYRNAGFNEKGNDIIFNLDSYVKLKSLKYRG